METAYSVVRASTSLDARRLFERMSVSPAAIGPFHRHGQWVAAGVPANLTIVEWDGERIYDRFESKSANSPFTGEALVGSVRGTVFEGSVTYQNGVVAEEGSRGRTVVR